MKKWKKMIVAVCTASMFVTMPGMSVLADEMREDNKLIVEEDEVPEESVESVDTPIEGVTESVDAPIKEDAPSQEAAEEVVGEGPIQVGDGVTATFDADTGAVELTSQGGELWLDWVDKLGVGRNEIKSIRIVSGMVYLPADSSGCYYDDNNKSVYTLFGGLKNLTSLELRNINTSNVTNMDSMFDQCSSLTNLDLSSFNTSNVTNMRAMFSGCSSLTNLDLSSFNTSNVTGMSYMFSGCSSLATLDLSSFDTSNVTVIHCMFFGCSSLTNLDLSNFDTSKVTMIGSMFRDCSSLTSLDLSSFDTSKVTDLYGVFYGCSSLTSLDLSSFDTSNVTNMTAMFRDCSKLTNLDLSSFNTSNVTDMSHMFIYCRSLANLDLSSFDTSNVKGMRFTFGYCESLTSLDLSSFDTSNLTNTGYMFSGCSSLSNLYLNNFDTSNVTYMDCMFRDCSSLTSLDLSNFGTSNVTNMSYMFSGCSSLTTLDLSNFDTSNVTNMSYMFSDCSSLISLDLSGFTTSILGDMAYMFSGCSSLTSLDLSSFDTRNVKYTNYMFSDCSALQLLKTPELNRKSIELPYIMCDIAGNEYGVIPALLRSIVLTRKIPSTKTDISDYEITLSATSYIYDGKEKEPAVIFNNGNIALNSETDYTLSYTDNINAGTVTVKVTGTGNYKGEKSITFTINKADAKLVFSKSAVTKKTTDAAFNNVLTKTTDGAVMFGSSDTKVATVDNLSGLVTIKGVGTTVIMAMASEGQNYKSGSAAYTLTVEAPSPTPAAAGFSDVQDPNHAYYKAIYWAADAGITKGYSDGTFGINRSCTRGEMMMFLWRYARKPSPKTVSKSPFKDVPKTHTFYKAILWGSQKGITKGYTDGTFGINRNVSRGECMMFLWRLKGKPAPTAVAKVPFPDVPKSHVFYNAVLWGYQKKITTGFTSGELKGKFGVNENCSRGQIVTFLYRAK